MTLELAPDVAAGLIAAASAAGRPAEELAAEVLRQRFVTPTLEECQRRLDAAARPDGVAIPPHELTSEQLGRILDAVAWPTTAVLTNDQLRREEMYD